MRKRKIIIGSRGSKLAILYAEKAKEKIMSILDGKSINKIEIKKIITQGDKVLDKRVSEIGGKGLEYFDPNYIEDIQDFLEKKLYSEEKLYKLVLFLVFSTWSFNA